MTGRIVHGLVLFGVLFQGLSAGLFMGRLDAPGWLRVHQVAAVATVVVALVAVIVADRRLAGAGLLVLLVVQTGLGQAIADGHRSMVAVHVPLAVVLTALSAYLVVTAVRTRPATRSAGTH